MMFGASIADRAAQAAKELAEALSIAHMAPKPPPLQTPQSGPPQGGPPSAPVAGGGLPSSPPPAPAPQPGGATLPAASPLQGLPSFKSPPLAAYLQKAAGAQGPVGFAKGGFAVKIQSATRRKG